MYERFLRNFNNSTQPRRAKIITASLAALVLVPACDDSSEAACKPFKVYAQNRFPLVPQTDSFGAAFRSAPKLGSEKIGSAAGNDDITVTGWLDNNSVVDSNNPPELENGVWLKLKNRIDGRDAWVTYRGVRAGLTERDPTGTSLDLGPLVPLRPECEINETGQFVRAGR